MAVTYVAQLLLKIDGDDASSDVVKDIVEVSVEESLYLPGMFTLTINNPYYSGRDSDEPWQYDSLFEIGTSIQIGFVSSTTQDTSFSQQTEGYVLEGEITAIESHFTSGAQATLIVRGYDVSHRLHRGRFNRSFQNMSDSDIVEKIAGEVGISLGTIDESGGPYGYGDINDESGYVFQRNQTNMEFLRERAARYGFELFVQDSKLNFRQPQSSEPLELQWLKEVHSFHVRTSSLEQVNNVEVRGWDYSQKSVLAYQKSSSSDEAITETEFGEGKDTSSAFSGLPTEPQMIVVNQPFFIADEGEQIAQSLFDEISREFVQAQATAEGNPEIRPGKVIKMSDMDKYSGEYYITSTRHLYSQGRYTTEFDIRGIRGDELATLLSLKPLQQPGQGVLVGIVSNNQDPKGWGRVRVKFPTLTEEHESYWARVVGIGAGTERGFDCLPEVNDEVLVAFEGGDIHRPYVIGGVWNGQDSPPEQVDDSVVDGQVRLRTIKTRTGHILQFVEEDKDSQKKGVHLDTVYGHQIYLNDGDKQITIKTNEGHTICLDDQEQKITVQTSQADQAQITLNNSTGEISMQAETKIILSAGEIEISATGNVTIKGSLIQLN